MTDGAKDFGAEIDKELRSTSRVSLEEEEKVGQEVLDAIREELGGLQSSGSVVEYLSAVARPMVARAARKNVRYRFYYAPRAKMENALALPGGHIVVTKPLLEKWVKNEAQLAIVLGHEIGHVEKRHPVAVIELAKAAGLSLIHI